MTAPAACPHPDVGSAPPEPPQFRNLVPFSGLAALRVLTLNHRQMALSELSALSLGREAADDLQASLFARGLEHVVLSTCNRTELYWRSCAPGDDEGAEETFARSLRADPFRLGDTALRLTGEDAARHLFRVCCGVESLVLGEGEILGQAREAFERARSCGELLGGVFRAALRTGRQARAETAISVGAMSVASVAVRWLATERSLPTSRVLVIGAGDTAAKAARQLRAEGVGQLVIANRTLSHAEALAGAVQADATTLDRLTAELVSADAVLVAAQAPSWIVTAADLHHAVADRAAAPLVVVDLSMPAAVENEYVPGVTRLDLAGLESAVAENRLRRESEVPKVEAVIERELGWLHAWARHHALRPLVSELRRKVEAIRRTEIARLEAELAGSGVDRAVLDRLSRRLLDRVLGIPLATLEAGDLPLDTTHAEYLRRLFALGTESH